MIQDTDIDIVYDVVIGAHITHLLETARIMVEEAKNGNYIKISYRDEGKSFGCKYYMITASNTNKLLQEIERWIRLFIKDNSNIDFTNGAFKNFKLYIF